MRMLTPQWDAPPAVRAVMSTRSGGVSAGTYESLNLALHTGDDADLVLQNRRLFYERADLPEPPLWLNQVHGSLIAALELLDEGQMPPTADGAVTRKRRKPLAIMTADCLPILACDRLGTVVGAFHGGWRSLADGILQKGVSALGTVPEDLLFWIGPGIGADSYQVGPEVYESFVAMQPEQRKNFKSDGPGKWMMDLSSCAATILEELGVGEIFQAPWCTFRDTDLFFSHRREHPCGRMAAVIWLE